MADPWKIVTTVIPLPEVWQAIESGEARRQKESVLAVSAEVSKRVMPQLRSARGDLDFLLVGALAEQMMRARGQNMESGGCGRLNTDILGDFTVGNYRLAMFSLSARGVTLRAEVEEGKYVRNCGRCGTVINKVIPKGYRCVCGGIYLGC